MATTIPTPARFIVAGDANLDAFTYPALLPIIIPTPDPKHEAHILAADAEIRGIALGIVEAINTHTYETHPVQESVAPSFRFCNKGPGVPGIDYVAFMSLLRGKGECEVSHSAEVVDLTSWVDLAAGGGEVAVTLDIYGNPPGVVRRIIGQHEFRFRRGRWVLVKYLCMVGIGGACVGGV